MGAATTSSSALTVCGALRGPAFPVWVAISPAVLWQDGQATPGAGARLGVAHVDPRCCYLPARPDATLGRAVGRSLLRQVAETRSDNPLLRFTGFCKQCTHTGRPRNARAKPTPAGPTATGPTLTATPSGKDETK